MLSIITSGPGLACLPADAQVNLASRGLGRIDRFAALYTKEVISCLLSCTLGLF